MSHHGQSPLFEFPVLQNIKDTESENPGSGHNCLD